MSGPTLTPTFRDPAGSLQMRDGVVVRTVAAPARENVLAFLQSDFYRRVRGRGDMVSSSMEDTPAGLQLFHPRIATISYPWEWTPLQWLAAAELTLRLCAEAVNEGWILKDATPLNILFDGSRPVLVDVLSFERRDPGSRIWLAYGQYVRTFLLPLIAFRLLHWPLQLSLFRRDGYEPAEVYASLSWHRRLAPGAFWPVTLPVWLDRRNAGATVAPPASAAADPELTLHLLQKTINGLLKRTVAAVPSREASSWSDYTSTLTHYSPAEQEEKSAWVESRLTRMRPARVLDIGANTGDFSALAADAGASVVALERDGAAAERIFARSRISGHDILTIHADLSRPTPAVGWNNAESLPLLARLEGGFDLVMMLAVIHHLILLEQIPIPAILALCHSLTTRFLILEWVPATDPMFQSLMRGRQELYGALSANDLLAAAEGRFTLLEQRVLGNQRVLYLFERR